MLSVMGQSVIVIHPPLDQIILTARCLVVALITSMVQTITDTGLVWGILGSITVAIGHITPGQDPLNGICVALKPIDTITTVGEKMYLLLDGNSIFSKWFFGFQNGLFGFYNELANLIRDYKPDEIHIAFDSDTSWRKELYPDYKGNRPTKPPEYYEQLTYLKYCLVKAGFSVYEEPSYEADDLLATLSVAFRPCLIVSDDKDLFQLLNPYVSVRRDKLIWTPATFESVYGFEPEYFPHLQALMGDEVDRIPGVTQIGPKRATLLVKEYGTLDKLYSDLPIGSWGQKLLLSKDDAYLSLKLATLEHPTLAVTYGNYDLERLRLCLTGQ